MTGGSLPEGTNARSERILDPIDRVAEVWFGLIIVLTFTCSISVKNAGREDVKEMVLAAFGCNVAWGLLDGFIYLQACFVRRASAIASLRAMRLAADRESAHRLILHSMPPLIGSVLSEEELDSIQAKLIRRPEVEWRPHLTKRDWLGGLGVFLAVFLATFPVAVPFLFMINVRHAMRVSNGIAVVMLFLTGYAFGMHAHHRPWRMGLWMLLFGSVLVAITIYLGG